MEGVQTPFQLQRGYVELILFRVGRFYEIYGEDALKIIPGSGLEPVTGLRGFWRGCGFYRRYLPLFLRKIRKNGFHVVLVEETRDSSGVQERRPTALYRRL